ncbi:DUF3822 family protein [Polaribacter aestuariivivens]|uniref:DUF3822 family protein n=1 Tax=Polaribacter aestuariivivens TaxID=2304626 RepID=UPI001FEA9E06|nr:DUF3822 family protein [Polaribacter aestuariivivens]
MKNTKNKILSIQFNLDGFSFSIKDSISKKDIHFCAYQFEKTQQNPENLLSEIEAIFKNDTHLQQDFDNVEVIHQNNLFTIVPNEYFNEKNLTSYLNFNIKVLATDFIAFDDLESNDAKNIFVPYININNYLFNNFGEFEYKHHNTLLIDKFTQKNNKEQKAMFVNVSKTTLDIVVLEKKQLILSNSFTYHSKEDFLYYVLFVAEQLQLNTNEFPLHLTGEISVESDIYKLIYKYIKNVSFLESNNTIFNKLDLQKHANFILLG